MTDLQGEIERILAPVLSGTDGGVAGFTVGVVSTRDGFGAIYYFGHIQYETDGPQTVPNDSTLWEIGSCSKTFTAAVLAGTAVAQSPLNPYLYMQEPVYPFVADQFPGGGLPSHSWIRNITLLQLANYTSGLPRNNTDLGGPDSTYSVQDMFTDLADNITTQQQKPGTYCYSNLGFALLASAMQNVHGSSSSYADLVRSFLFEPLGMIDTTFVFNSSLKIPLGYCLEAPTFPAANKTWPAYLGAGGIVSTGPGFMQWLKFNMGLTDTWLNRALPLLKTETLAAGSDHGAISLAWVLGDNASPLHWSKDGGVPRFKSYIRHADDGVGMFISGNVNYDQANIAQDIMHAIRVCRQTS